MNTSISGEEVIRYDCKIGTRGYDMVRITKVHTGGGDGGDLACRRYSSREGESRVGSTEQSMRLFR